MAKTGTSARKAAEILGVSHTAVGKFKNEGRFVVFEDGSLCPKSVDRLKRERAARRGNPVAEVLEPGETAESAAERIVIAQGHAPHTLAEAERIKENYLAKLKELEFDIKSGEVIRIADVRAIVAAEYAAVRSRLLPIGAEVAPRAAFLTSPPELQELYDEAVGEALDGLTLDRQPDDAQFARAIRR
jgi:non-ribosomal peptide synthetase component E (peptide arylation enzyme)